MGKTVTNPNRAARWVALFCVLALASGALHYCNSPPAIPVSQAPGKTQSEVYNQQPAGAALELLTIDTRAGPKTFKIEVARTPEQQALGLMFRTKLPDDEGMLFPHDDAREVTMWMRNTFIALDMVFIRADGEIHRIEANTEPMSERVIASNGPVGGVLEIAGGAASRLGIAPGDRVHHQQFRSSGP